MLTANYIVGAITGHRNAEIDLDGCGRVYMRRSHRMIERQTLRCLDVADINVIEAHRRQGIFSNVISAAEEAAKLMQFDAVFVESILNEIVVDALTRRGYSFRWVVRELQIDAYKLMTDYAEYKCAH